MPNFPLLCIDKDALLTRASFLRASAVMPMPSMMRYQDVKGENARLWLSANDEVIVTLFVSHRWESPLHPDPSGSQTRILAKLLHYLVEFLIACTQKTDAERRRILPSLRRYGVFQAVNIMGRVDEFESWIVRLSNLNLSLTDLRDLIANKIGVWIDYCCLPQKEADGTDHRSDEEMKQFRDGLRLLGSIARSSAFVSIRNAGDDYEERGWCVAEMAYIENAQCDVNILRSDLISVCDTLLDWSFFEDTTEQFQLCLLFWEGGGTLSQQRDDGMPSPTQWPPTNASESKWSIPALTIDFTLFSTTLPSRRNWIDDTQSFTLTDSEREDITYDKQFVVPMKELEQRLSKPQDNRDDNSALLPCDIGAEVRKAMDAANLNCTSRYDLAIVGLHILLAVTLNFVPYDPFWELCLERLLEDKTLVVTQFERTQSGKTMMDLRMGRPGAPMRIHWHIVFEDGTVYDHQGGPEPHVEQQS